MTNLIVQAFWYFDQVSGEFRYRIQDPGDALATHPNFDVINIHVFHPLFSQLVLAADLLILHLMPDSEVDKIIRIRRQLGKPTIFEIADNFLQLGPWIPPEDAHRNPLVRQNFFRYAAAADALQFSTDEVRKSFDYLNEQHFVFENQIGSFTQVTRDDDSFVFGWGGSKGHEEDLAEVAPAIIEFCRQHPNAVFSYMGFVPIFERHFSAIPKAQVQVREAGPLEDYYEFLQTLHIGIAPLRNTEFNRCRSDVKFLEYAAHGVVPILATAPPYLAHGKDRENALFFSTPDSLVEALESLYQDRVFLKKMSDQAFQYVSKRRNIHNHIGKKAHIYQKLIRNAEETPMPPPLPPSTGMITYLRQISAKYTAGDYAAALEITNKALNMLPSFPQAQLWRAKIWIETGAFQKVWDTHSTQTHDPIYGDLIFECLVIAAAKLEIPNWERLLLKIEDPILRAQLDPESNRNQEEKYRLILKENPWDYLALMNLAKILLRRGDVQGLELLDRAAYLDPESTELPILRQKAAVKLEKMAKGKGK